MQSAYAEYFLRTPLHEPYTPNEIRLHHLVFRDEMVARLNRALTTKWGPSRAPQVNTDKLKGYFESYTAARFPLDAVDPADFFSFVMSKVPPEDDVPLRTYEQELAWRKDPRGIRPMPLPAVEDRNSDRVLSLVRF